MGEERNNTLGSRLRLATTKVNVPARITSILFVTSLLVVSILAALPPVSGASGPVLSVSASCCNGEGTTYTVNWAGGNIPTSTTIVQWGYNLECGDWKATGTSSAFWHHPTPAECTTSAHWGTVTLSVYDYKTGIDVECIDTGGSDSTGVQGSNCITTQGASTPTLGQQISYNQGLCAGIFPPASCGKYAIFSGVVGNGCGPQGNPPLIFCNGFNIFIQTTPQPQVSPVTGETFGDSSILSASENLNATSFVDGVSLKLSPTTNGYLSAAIPNSFLNGPFTVILNGAPWPFNAVNSGGYNDITLTKPLNFTVPATLTVTASSSSVGTTAPPYQETIFFTANVAPSQTTIGSNTAVQTSYTNNSNGPATAIVYAVVHNSNGQTVAYSTTTLTNVPAGGSATAYDVLFGLAPGTYSVTIFATSTSGTAISTTSTVTVTI